MRYFFTKKPTPHPANREPPNRCPRFSKPSGPMSLFSKKNPKFRHLRSEQNFQVHTWRIIPVSKWLGSPPFISHLAHLEGEKPYLGDLLTLVINHLLTGMILQVVFQITPWHGVLGSKNPFWKLFRTKLAKLPQTRTFTYWFGYVGTNLFMPNHIQLS